MQPENWASIILSFLVALGAREAIPGVIKWVTGTTKRRRAEIDRMAKERDLERMKVRILRESLSLHRRMMYEAPCIPPEKVPDYPDLPKE